MITLWIHWKQSCVLLLIFIHSTFFVWENRHAWHFGILSLFKSNPPPNMFSAACPSHWLTRLIPSINPKEVFIIICTRDEWTQNILLMLHLCRSPEFKDFFFFRCFYNPISLLQERCFENWWPHQKWELLPRSAQCLLALRWWRIWFCFLNTSLGEMFSWGVWKPAHSLSPLF